MCFVRVRERGRVCMLRKESGSVIVGLLLSIVTGMRYVFSAELDWTGLNRTY